MLLQGLEPMEKELFQAVYRNEVGKLETILENGTVPLATVTERMNRIWKWTPAQRAAQEGHLEILKVLVKKEPTLLTRKLEAKYDEYQPSVLELAVQYRHFDIVKYLVEECNVDIFQEHNIISPSDGFDVMNPIYMAAETGHLEILKYLVEKGNVDVNAPFRSTRNSTDDLKQPRSLLYLVINGHADSDTKRATLEYLMNETNIDITVDNGRILYMDGRLEIIRRVLDKLGDKFDINKKHHCGETLLYAHASNVKVIQYLVEMKRANVNIPRDDSKWTPLHTVTAENCLEACKCLINYEANIEAEDIDGDTPLHFASMSANFDICKLLIKHGANVNRANHVGDSPLHCAVMGHFKKFGGSIDLFFVDRKASRVFAYLVDRGANLTQKNNEGITPIEGIISKGRLKYLEYLIRRGIIDVNWKNEREETLVHLAVISNQMFILDYLVRRKHAEINTRRAVSWWDRWTPLHSALSLQHYETCKYLIKHGADVTFIDWRDDEHLLPENASKVLDRIKFEVRSGRARRSIVQSSKIHLETSSLEKFTDRRLPAFENTNYPIPFAADPFLSGITYQFGGFLTLIHYAVSYFAGLVYKPELTFSDERTVDVSVHFIEDAMNTLPDFQS